MQSSSSKRLRISRQQALIGGVLLGILAALVALYMPEGGDYDVAFRPAGQALLHGESPYENGTFANPAWVAVALIPFAIPSDAVGFGLLFALSLAGFAITAYHMGASPARLALFLTTPSILQCLWAGNLDGLVLFGLLLPPPVGMLFMLAKPQVGIGLAVWWVIEAWREGGVRRVIEVCWPVGIAGLASLAVFGTEPLQGADFVNFGWNVSAWIASPVLSILAGLLLMTIAVRDRSARAALAAGVFFAPYATFHSWSGVLIASVNDTRRLALIWAIMWIIVFLLVVAYGT